ncbi:hypothetical protein HMPREF9151_01980 [Hoylesella saccharolytica F0055]|uniref:Uncharacterized protein n=1 Tax=Hoylesella saccharolytica F0055 TaxID=1127699 RepID=L1N5I8_9BACT|nr:hypothetical protein HMPREF9151_01980 [Hoylesella saccharolytica F0055]
MLNILISISSLFFPFLIILFWLTNVEFHFLIDYWSFVWRLYRFNFSPFQPSPFNLFTFTWVGKVGYGWLK